jgi:hypothetical protein
VLLGLGSVAVEQVTRKWSRTRPSTVLYLTPAPASMRAPFRKTAKARTADVVRKEMMGAALRHALDHGAASDGDRGGRGGDHPGEADSTAALIAAISISMTR